MFLNHFSLPALRYLLDQLILTDLALSTYITVLIERKWLFCLEGISCIFKNVFVLFVNIIILHRNFSSLINCGHV